MSTFYLFAALLSFCGVYAAWWGGSCERWAIALQVSAFILGLPWWRRLLIPPHLVFPFLAIDLVLLTALVILATRARRFWPVWVAAFQLAAVIAHLSKAVAPTMIPQGYSILIQLWGYPMLMLTAAGTRWHRQRSRLGSDPSWRKDVDRRRE